MRLPKEYKMKITSYQALSDQQQSNPNLKRKAQHEARVLRTLQLKIKKALLSYMKRHKIGFNEVVRRLNSAPDQVSRMQKGTANLTLASLAHLSAMLEMEPTLIFKKRL